MKTDGEIRQALLNGQAVYHPKTGMTFKLHNDGLLITADADSDYSKLDIYFGLPEEWELKPNCEEI